MFTLRNDDMKKKFLVSSFQFLAAIGNWKLKTKNSNFKTRNSKLETRNFSKGFTLLEMLVVIGILAVLLGMLYGALERTRKFSRYTITFNELKQIQAAFEQYYAYYHTWPTNGVTQMFDMADGDGGLDKGFMITRDIARALQGVATTAFTDDNNPNPDRIPFMEFPRFNGNGDPVNPFRATRSENPNENSRCYVVLFDTSGNRQLTIEPDPLVPDATSTTIVANVAVWTVIPGFRTATGSGAAAQTQAATEMRLGSWEPFDLRR